MITTRTVRARSWHMMVLLAILAFIPLSSAYADDRGMRNGLPGMGVEVNIGSNGGALVRGAQVTAVSDTEIKASTSLGQSVLSWVIKTDGDTDYSAHRGGAEGRAHIAVGDTISFRGAIDQGLSGLVIKAKQVKDWSSVETKQKLNGVVTSLNTSLNSFTVKKGDATTTVQTSSSTTFTKDGDSASFADLVLNAKVKIQGLFNASTSVFTAHSVEINSEGAHKAGLNGWAKGWLKFWKD